MCVNGIQYPHTLWITALSRTMRKNMTDYAPWCLIADDNWASIIDFIEYRCVLKNCLLVSKRFHRIICGKIWLDIHFGCGPLFDKLASTPTSYDQRIKSIYMNHIRSINEIRHQGPPESHPFVIGIASMCERMTALRSLEVYNLGIDRSTKRRAEGEDGDSLWHKSIRYEFFKRLSESKSLSEIRAMCCSIDDECMRIISTTKNLTRLRIASDLITEQVFNSLTGSEKLVHLSLVGSRKIGGGSLKNLSRIAGLQSLDLSSCGLVDEQIVCIGGLRNLTELRLYGNALTNKALIELSSLRLLENLYIGRNKIGEEPIRGLTGFKSLLLLDARNNSISDCDLAQIAGIQSLTKLYLSNNRIGSGAISAISSMENLLELDLSENDIKELRVEEISRMKGLSDLRLPYIRKDIRCDSLGQELVGQGCVLDKDMFFTVSKWKTISHLDLDGWLIGNEGVACIAWLSSLRTLSLNECGFDASVVHCIASMRKLRVLYMSNNAVCDEGAVHLSSLVELKILYLSGCQLTSKSTINFVALTRLGDLNLSNNRIDDEGVKNLITMDSLYYLDISRNEISLSGKLMIEEFEKSERRIVKTSNNLFDEEEYLQAILGKTTQLESRMTTAASAINVAGTSMGGEYSSCVIL